MLDAMLVDATYERETRIVVLENGRIQELHYESDDQEPIVGNIYLGRIARVEPGLEAAFVDYGAERQGFLSLRQVHKSWFRSTGENGGKGGGLNNLEWPGRSDGKSALVSGSARFSEALMDLKDYSLDFAETGKPDSELFKPVKKKPSPNNSRSGRKRNSKPEQLPRIEDVLHPGQILLVQISKDEINEKGAALTTHISLPGRYCVLLPISGRGCEISKRITDRQTRSRLESIYGMLDVPDGSGLIMRSVLSNPDKKRVKADFNSLMDQWNQIREKCKSGKAPRLVHTEGNIITRTLRDLNTQSVNKIIVDGGSGFEHTRKAISMMMPEALGMLENHKGDKPLFVEADVERQIYRIQQPRIDLKSGGQIVIEQTEAMVTIDVNSAKASKGTTVEGTAVQTNIEAAAEIARQLRLRDLAGIIAIDFIDMTEHRHRHEVMRTLKKETLRDRSKISMEQISTLGLLEMSRQRLRKSVTSQLTDTCIHCRGTGRVARDSMLALTILRHVEGECSKPNIGHVKATVPVIIGNYMLNELRDEIIRIEGNHSCTVAIDGSAEFEGDFEIEVYHRKDDRVVSRISPDILLHNSRSSRGKASQGRQISRTTDSSSTGKQQRKARDKTKEMAEGSQADSKADANGKTGRQRTNSKSRSGSKPSRKRKSSSMLSAEIRSGSIETEMEHPIGDGSVFASDPDTGEPEDTSQYIPDGAPGTIQQVDLSNHPVTDLLEFQTFQQQ